MIKQNSKFKKFYLLTLAFVVGLTIMAVEITASRLIAPYFGTSIFVWTNIIGVIMLALAIGYYFGGKFADMFIRLEYLLKLVFIACLILLLIPFITKPLVLVVVQEIVVFESATLLIFIGSLLVIILLFMLPIILLGMVSPFIIKQLSLINPRIGTDAGLVFSVSTIGSLLGTFLPVLLFIPNFGTRRTIMIFTLILLLVTISGLFKKGWLIGLFILFLPLFFLINLPQIKSVNGAVYETESAYKYLLVQDKNNYRYLLTNECLGISSAINQIPGEFLTGYYYDYYNLLPYLAGNDKKQDILILGLAGGTISTQLDHFFANDYDLKIDGVEIDNKVIKLAEQYFDLANPSLTVYNLDARNFLNYTDKKYNSIIIDAYSEQHYIPFHLTTKEFFTEVKSSLKPKGLVAMNINATSSKAELLQTMANTMVLVFDHVYLIPTQTDWNYMVLATDQRLDFEQIKEINTIAELSPIIDHIAFDQQELVYNNKFNYLTDDKAPIEYLTEGMILQYIFNNLN